MLCGGCEHRNHRTKCPNNSQAISRVSITPCQFRVDRYFLKGSCESFSGKRGRVRVLVVHGGTVSETHWGANRSVATVDRQTGAVFHGGNAAVTRTLTDILDATAADCPNAAAIDDGTEVLTYHEMLFRIAE